MFYALVTGGTNISFRAADLTVNRKETQQAEKEFFYSITILKKKEP